MLDPLHVLILDDDPHYQHLTAKMLNYCSDNNDLKIFSALSVLDANKQLLKQTFDLAYIDLSLHGTIDAGVTFLEVIKKKYPTLECIIHSSQENFSLAQRCIRAGASDYLLKGYTKEEFKVVFSRAVFRRNSTRMKQQLKHEAEKNFDKYKILGESEEIKIVKSKIQKLAKTRVPILIEAETGSGKELVARNLHYYSELAEKPFVAIDCSTIPLSLADSFLFGHEKGAFTGAHREHQGIFEQANGGTLFLDEITSLPLSLQTKFLRVLEQQEFRRVGSNKIMPLNFRLLSAGNKSIEKLVEQGLFKEDLYYRLQAVVLHIPPLRKRKSDLPLLLKHFCGKNKISKKLQVLLNKYDWPGNIRECRNLCIALEALAGNDPVFDIHHLPESMLDRLQAPRTIMQTGVQYHWRDWKKMQEKEFLKNTYLACGMNISVMARKLRVDRSHLYMKLKYLNIHKSKR